MILNKDRKKILVIAAHPDDEVIGCGGTMSRLKKEGCEISTLILGEGIRSRYFDKNNPKIDSKIKDLKSQALKANRIIGSEGVFFFNFPDNKFDTVPFLEIVRAIEKIKTKVKPEIIFTHFRKDLNIDHRVTYKAVITATRPIHPEIVKEIYSFEVLSSSEWNYPERLSPNVFFDITKTIKNKLKAAGIYKNEIRKYPHPRSLEGIELNSKYWGMRAGLKHAEAFELIRIIK